MKICKENQAVSDSRNMRTLCESCFLHDGRISSGVSFFTMDSSSAATVDSSERLYNVNLTGIRVSSFNNKSAQGLNLFFQHYER